MSEEEKEEISIVILYEDEDEKIIINTAKSLHLGYLLSCFLKSLL